jgi:hypothetical protein
LYVFLWMSCQPENEYKCFRARICKCLRSPGIDAKESIPKNRFQIIDSKESIPPAYVRVSYRPARPQAKTFTNSGSDVIGFCEALLMAFSM